MFRPFFFFRWPIWPATADLRPTPRVPSGLDGLLAVLSMLGCLTQLWDAWPAVASVFLIRDGSSSESKLSAFIGGFALLCVDSRLSQQNLGVDTGLLSSDEAGHFPRVERLRRCPAVPLDRCCRFRSDVRLSRSAPEIRPSRCSGSLYPACPALRDHLRKIRAAFPEAAVDRCFIVGQFSIDRIPDNLDRRPRECTA